MQIEITSLCNLDCKRCYRKETNRQTGHMALETFKEIIDKLVKSDRLSKNIYGAGFGESMLNPDFWDMVKYAKRNDCFFMLPTNGTLLNEENIPKFRMIDALQLSFDSFVINDELRSGSESSLRWISLLKKWKVPLQINVTVGEENYLEIPDFIKYSIRNQIPIYFMFTTPFNEDDQYRMNQFKFCLNHLNEIRHTLSQFHVSAEIDTGCNSFQKCRYINNDFSISWDGKLKPCNDTLLTNIDFGNISDYKNFDIFLNGYNMQKVWNGKHPICNFCKKLDKIRNNFSHSLIYDSRIDIFKDIHKNKRCFILGTGPSLTKKVIDLLRNEITIGVNQITFAKELWDFEPTYYNFADCGSVLNEEYFKSHQKLTCPKFYSNQIYYQAILEGNTFQFSEEQGDYFSSLIAVNWINPELKIRGLVMPNKNLISFDLQRGTLESGTVTQALSIPFAVWLGCNEIYLVGCDCTGHKHFYDEECNDDKWKQGYDIIRQYGWFQERLSKLGIKLFNLSPISKLPNIPNIDIDTLFK